MKDFYDVWVLSKNYEFDSDRLVPAIAATFARRGTEVPDTLPDAFTPEFFRNASKLQQWSAFGAGRLLAPFNAQERPGI